jgi:hypothetical protein
MSAERQMTSTCRRLRTLEATIEAQRRVIDDRKAQHIDDQKERQRLAELLTELDEVIRPAASVELLMRRGCAQDCGFSEQSARSRRYAPLSAASPRYKSAPGGDE